MKPGDVFLVEGHSFADRLIALAQRRRCGTAARFTHCGIITSAAGDTIEATHTGTKRGTLAGRASTLVPITASPDDIAHGLAYAEAQVGREYGFVDIVSLGLALLTGGTLSFQTESTLVCSQLVTEYLEHLGRISPRDSASMSPGDVAGWLHVS